METEGDGNSGGGTSTSTGTGSQISKELENESPKLPPLIVELRKCFRELSPFLEPFAYHDGLDRNLLVFSESFVNRGNSLSAMQKAVAQLSTATCQEILWGLLLPTFDPCYSEEAVRSCLMKYSLDVLLDAVLSESHHNWLKNDISQTSMRQSVSSVPFGSPGLDAHSVLGGDRGFVGAGAAVNSWTPYALDQNQCFGGLGGDLRGGGYSSGSSHMSNSYPMPSHNHSTANPNNNNNTNSNNNKQYLRSASSGANRFGSAPYSEDSGVEKRDKSDRGKQRSSSHLMIGGNPSHQRSAPPPPPPLPPPPPPPPHSGSPPNSSLVHPSSPRESSAGGGKGWTSDEDYERTPSYSSKGNRRADGHAGGGGGPPQHYRHSQPPHHSHHHVSNSHRSNLNHPKSTVGDPAGVAGSGTGYRTGSSGGRGSYKSVPFTPSAQPYDSTCLPQESSSRSDSGGAGVGGNAGGRMGMRTDSSTGSVFGGARGGAFGGSTSSSSSGGSAGEGNGYQRGRGPANTDSRSESSHSLERQNIPLYHTSSSPSLPADMRSNPPAGGPDVGARPPLHHHHLPSRSPSFHSSVDPMAQQAFPHANSTHSTVGVQGCNTRGKEEVDSAQYHHHHPHLFPAPNEIANQRGGYRGGSRAGGPPPAFGTHTSESPHLHSPPSSFASSSTSGPAAPLQFSGTTAGVGMIEQGPQYLGPSYPGDRSPSCSHVLPPSSTFSGAKTPSPVKSSPAMPSPSGPQNLRFSPPGKLDRASPPSERGSYSSALQYSSRPGPNSNFSTPGVGNERNSFYPVNRSLSINPEDSAAHSQVFNREDYKSTRDYQLGRKTPTEVKAQGEVISSEHCSPAPSIQSFRSGSEVNGRSTYGPLRAVGGGEGANPSSVGLDVKNDSSSPLPPPPAPFPPSMNPIPRHHHHFFDEGMAGKASNDGARGPLSPAVFPQHHSGTSFATKAPPNSFATSPSSPPSQQGVAPLVPANVGTESLTTQGVLLTHHHHHHHHHHLQLTNPIGGQQGTPGISKTTSSNQQTQGLSNRMPSALPSSVTVTTAPPVIPHHVHHIHHVDHFAGSPSPQQVGGVPSMISSATLPSHPSYPLHHHHNILPTLTTYGDSRQNLSSSAHSDSSKPPTPPSPTSAQNHPMSASPQGPGVRQGPPMPATPPLPPSTLVPSGGGDESSYSSVSSFSSYPSGGGGLLSKQDNSSQQFCASSPTPPPSSNFPSTTAQDPRGGMGPSNLQFHHNHHYHHQHSHPPSSHSPFFMQDGGMPPGADSRGGATSGSGRHIQGNYPAIDGLQGSSYSPSLGYPPGLPPDRRSNSERSNGIRPGREGSTDGVNAASPMGTISYPYGLLGSDHDGEGNSRHSDRPSHPYSPPQHHRHHPHHHPIGGRHRALGSGPGTGSSMYSRGGGGRKGDGDSGTGAGYIQRSSSSRGGGGARTSLAPPSSMPFENGGTADSNGEVYSPLPPQRVGRTESDAHPLPLEEKEPSQKGGRQEEESGICGESIPSHGNYSEGGEEEKGREGRVGSNNNNTRGGRGAGAARRHPTRNRGRAGYGSKSYYGHHENTSTILCKFYSQGQCEEKYSGMDHSQNKGGAYHYHSRPPSYGSGVERGRGYGRQIGYPGRGLNFRSSNYNVDQLPPPPPLQRQFCKFFSEGRCKFGASCHNIHDGPEHPRNVASPEPCKFFAQGNCKYGDRCRNIHSTS